MYHCAICRRRKAIQEVTFEASHIFLCTICFTRMEIEHAEYDYDAPEDEEIDYVPDIISLLHKEKIR